MAAFEDAGFYCVDNMPVALLPKFLELPGQNSSDVAGLVFVMDLREKGFLSDYAAVFEALGQKGYNLEILFLEADEDILLQRYSQTRRQHPMSQNKTLLEGILEEKQKLAGLKRAAQQVINTTNYNVHEFKSVVRSIAEKTIEVSPMKIYVQSFGFKFGIPHAADLVIDVRFLDNPFFIPHLKPLDGRDEAVRKYVLGNETARGFLEKYLDLLDYLVPLYEKEGKAYLTIAVGCTGGRHRSVAIADRIFEHLRKPGKQVGISHRDIRQPV